MHDRTPLATLRADLHAPLKRDPAVNGPLDVVLSYPGFHAITAHRAIHALWKRNVPIVPRFLAHLVRFATGIEIHPGATIGPGLFIDHGMGVVIGETAIVGRDVMIYQGVTLGGTSLNRGKRHPTIGDNVVIGMHAAVLGDINVGDNARIGAGSVVVKDVPPNSTIVGIPGRIVVQDGKPVRAVESRRQVDMPDPTFDVIRRLEARIRQLEERLATLNPESGGEERTDSLDAAAL